MQTETAAVQELVASCDRRAEKLQADLIAEQRAAQRKANDATLASFAQLSKRLPPHAHKIGEIVATLAAELEALHADALEVGDTFRALVVQLPQEVQLRYWDELRYCRFVDEVLGHCLVNELGKAGIFTTLAPTAAVTLPRLELPAIGETIERRVDMLNSRTKALHARLDESLK